MWSLCSAHTHHNLHFIKRKQPQLIHKKLRLIYIINLNLPNIHKRKEVQSSHLQKLINIICVISGIWNLNLRLISFGAELMWWTKREATETVLETCFIIVMCRLDHTGHFKSSKQWLDILYVCNIHVKIYYKIHSLYTIFSWLTGRYSGWNVTLKTLK